MEDVKLKKRLLELHYNNKEEHVGSCFSGLKIIDDIHSSMDKEYQSKPFFNNNWMFSRMN